MGPHRLHPADPALNINPIIRRVAGEWRCACNPRDPIAYRCWASGDSPETAYAAWHRKRASTAWYTVNRNYKKLLTDIGAARPY